MHITLKWDDEAGDTIVTPESLASIQERFAESEIDALDFLRDAIEILCGEYNGALNAWHSKACGIIEQWNDARP